MINSFQYNPAIFFVDTFWQKEWL